MFDVNSLDRMNFGDLSKTLNHILKKLEQLDEGGSTDEDDPRYDVLLVIANQVIVRMDSIIRDNAVIVRPEILDRWKWQTEEHRKVFKDYVRTYLKGGVPLLMVEPARNSRARREEVDAAYLAKLDEIVLDEKLLDGMNAGDLFQVNKFITEKIEQLDKELPEDVAAPLITKLVNFGNIVIRRLDPLVRETYKNDREKLAGWEAIMNDYKDLDDDGGENAGADIESSAVS